MCTNSPEPFVIGALLKKGPTEGTVGFCCMASRGRVELGSVMKDWVVESFA
jgi:hypothetical protein